MDAYERVLGDAMAGDATIFAREDYVEEAWRIVDPVLAAHTPVYPYDIGQWGPPQSETLVPPGGWDDPAMNDEQQLLSASRRPRRSRRRREVRGAVHRRAGGLRDCRARPLQVRGERRTHAVGDAARARDALRRLDQRLPVPGRRARGASRRRLAQLTHIRESLLDRVPIPPANVYPMPVERTDLVAAAQQYAQILATAAGTPPVLDLVHLGLGPDGHTASLVPHDPVLGEDFADVGLTQPYPGHRRMTLTYPMINRARCVLFVVTGSDKVAALAALRAGDPGIPAAHVTGQRLVVMADAAAAGDAGRASSWDRPAV
jgi:hypothetical protein